MTAPGNKEVVEILEKYLDWARAGEINYVGLFVCQRPDQIAVDFTGAVEMERFTPAAIDRLKAQIGQSIRDRQPPARDLALGADYVCYQPYSQPANFDFVSWLVQREMERVREGAPAPLRVGFWSPPGLSFKRQMLDGVLRAMVPLFGAVEDDAAKRGRVSPLDAGFINIVNACRAGEPVPKFKAPAAARRAVLNFIGPQPPIVTITLRETNYDVERNSNIPAWIGLAKHIQACGYRVIFVRDTAKAIEPISGFETLSTASMTLAVRMALYEQAEMNMFVQNGPATLALFSDVPWMMFHSVTDDNPVEISRPPWWRNHHGIEPGEQFPWSRPDQRIVWKRDEYETLVEAWEAMMEQKDAERISGAARICSDVTDGGGAAQAARARQDAHADEGRA